MIVRLLLLCLCAIPSFAVEAVFLPTSGNWSVPGNWSSGAVPALRQAVLIPEGRTATLDVDSAAVSTVTVQSSARLIVAPAKTLTASALANGGTVTLGGILRNATVTGVSLTYLSTSELDGVTVGSNQLATASLAFRGILTLGDGVTFALGDATHACDLGFRRDADSVARIASAGKSAVVVGSLGTASLADQAADTHMAIGAGVVVTGGSFQIAPAYSKSNLVIDGLVESVTAGKTVRVGNTTGNPVTIGASGAVRAADGALLMNGPWANNGKLVVDGGIMRLDGSFASGSVDSDHWARSGSGKAGTVQIAGTLTISRVLGLTPAMGQWQLFGGLLTGGEFDSSGPTLVGTTSGGSAQDVVLDANVDLSQANGASLTITGVVTLGAGRSIAVGGASTYGDLYFVGDGSNVATLATVKSASVVLGTSPSNDVRVNSANTRMVIDTGVAVTGGAGYVRPYHSGSTLTINGSVESATAGQLVTVGYAGAPTAVGVGGSLRVSNGQLTVAGPWSNAGTLAVSGGVLQLDGTFASGSVVANRWSRSGPGTAGTVRIAGTLTISKGLGLTPAMGPWQVYGGTITGDPLVSSGPTLIGTTSGGTLRDVSIDADIDLSQANGAALTVTGVVTLGAGRSIAVGGASTYGDLYFVGDGANVATLASAKSSAVVLGANAGNDVRVDSANTQMVIGTGVTVTGGAGYVRPYHSGSTLTINGVVESTSASRLLTVGYSGASTSVSAGGVLRVSNGQLTVTGPWSNAGTLAVSGGVLELDGTFGSASVADARWSRSGPGTAGTVRLGGTLTISGTLATTPAMGAWQLYGGLLTGGTVASSGPTLIGTASGGTARDLILDTNVDLSQANGAALTVTGVVTLGAGRSIAVGGASTYGDLYFVGNGANVATLASAGTSTVVLGANAGNDVRVDSANTQMVIGSGVTVTGGAGYVRPYHSGSTLTINGVVESTSASKLVTVGYSGASTSVGAAGVVRVSNGQLTVTGPWSNAGTLAVGGGVLELDGTFGSASVADARWSRSGPGTAGTVRLGGTLTISGTLATTPAMGAWQLYGGLLTGGTVASSGPTLIGTASGGTARDLILDTNVDLSQANGAALTVTGVVTLGAGRSIAVGGASTYGDLYFVGNGANVATLASAGTSTVVLGANAGNDVRVDSANTQMVIGSGVTVTGGAGYVRPYHSGSTLTINGVVESTSASKLVTVGYSGASTTVGAGGVVRVSNGQLTVTGPWSNAGTLAVGGGVLQLDGTFGSSSVADARWSRSGPGTAGTVRLGGTLTISGTLATTPAMGAWQLYGGLLTGGTVASSGPTLIGTASGGTARDLILDANVDLSQANGAALTVTGVVTLGAGRSVAVGGGSTYGDLYFVGNGTNVATLASAGTSTVVLGANAGNDVRVDSANTQMTIGTGVTVTGGAGFVRPYHSGSNLTIGGSVQAASSGKTLTVGYTGAPTAVAAGGLVTATGGILALQGPFTNAGTVRPGVGYALALTALSSFTQQASGLLAIEVGGTAVSQFDRLAATGAITLGGTLDLSLINGYTPGAGLSWNILTGGSVAGTFSAVTGPAASLFATSATASSFLLTTGNATLMTAPVGDPTNAVSIPLTITFATAVTGFTQSDMVVTNAVVGSFTGSGAVYTCNLVPTTANGTLTVSIPADVVDAPGNAPAVFTRLMDRSAPTLAVTPDGGTTTASPIVFTVTGDEALASLAANRITVTGAAAQVQQSEVAATADPAVWTVSVTPAGSGAVGISFAAGAAVDLAGNGSSAAAASVAYAGTNAAPQITEGPTVGVTIDEDNAPTAFALTLHATDADGDQPVWTVSVAAAHGSAEVTADGDDGIVAYVPAADFSGSDSFTVLADDGNGGTASCVVAVTIRPRNDAPVNVTGPSVVGTPQVGDTLSTTNGVWQDLADGGGSVIAFSYQWFRALDSEGGGATAIDEADAFSYTLTADDAGAWIAVEVTATDDGVGLPATASSTVSSAWIGVGGTPIASFDAGDYVASEGAGFVAGNPAVALTVRLSAPAGAPVTIPVIVGGTAGTGDAIISPTTVTFDAGATVATVSVSVVIDGLDGGSTARDETVVLSLGTPTGPATSGGTPVTLTIADEEPLEAQVAIGEGVPAAVDLSAPLAVTLVVGQAVALDLANGRPPFSVVRDPATRFYSFLPGILPDEDGDPDLDPNQRILVVADHAVSDAVVDVEDSSGARLRLLVTATAAPDVALAPPPVPVSDGGSTVYAGIAPGTAEGLSRFLAAFAGRGAGQARAFWWAAADQRYREIGVDSQDGLTPFHGIFLAARSPFALDFDGGPAGFYHETALEAGFNFVSIPPLSDGTVTATEHPFSSFMLFDAGGGQVTGAERESLIGTGAWRWDGSAYRLETTLRSGVAYWILNASDPGQRLALVRFPDEQSQAAARSVRNGGRPALVSDRVATADERRAAIAARDPGPLPAAPGAAQSDGGDGGGGSCGSGAGVILLGLAGFGLLRRRRW